MIFKKHSSQEETTVQKISPKSPQKTDYDAVHPTATAHPQVSPSKRKGPTTRLIIKFDVGFPNAIYLRGKGANLSWDKGLILKNTGTDEWVWETDLPFTQCEFKVLINDQLFETGDNHLLHCGATLRYTPKF